MEIPNMTAHITITEDKPMIEMGKKYQTRDGRAVRILCTDLKGCGCATVIGLVTQESGTEYVESWMADGSILPATQPSRNGKTACDLVPVSTKHEGWMLINACGQWFGGDIYTAERWAQEESDKYGSGVHVAHVTWED